MKTLFTALVLPLTVLLFGCAAGSPPQAINENSLIRVAATDKTGMFSANQEGHKIAVVRGGLHLYDFESGSSKKISSDQPVALAWSADGLVLAAVFPVADYETRLARYSAQGELLHEALLPVAFNQMDWSARGDLLVMGYVLKLFSFGADLQQILYNMTDEDVVATVLSDTTLRLSTVKKLAKIMRDVLPVAFSPAGDELVYLHLHEPPQFSPYLKLIYKNWQVANGRSLQEMPLQRVQVVWEKPAQSVAVRTADGVLKLDLWPTVEDVISQSTTNHYRFVSGLLYDGDELLADWGEGAQLQILPDGRFLMAANNVLWRGDGLRSEPQESYSERAWTLRRWRFEGLITADEYQKLLKEENQ